MRDITIGLEIGNVIAEISEPNTGFPPEYWAGRLADKIISVSANTPEPIRMQAMEYRKEIYEAALFFMNKAIESSRK